MIKAITPDQVTGSKPPQIPDVVIEAVNERLNSGAKTIYQYELVEEIKRRDPTLNNGRIYGERMLDFEDFYRAAGWKVKYDKPAYCETYEPCWEFTPASDKE